uniref:Uncharacterized protein n=1 Tax=Picea sitchensis TaxID=3332 RepID=D5AEA3_PICSI|nr:unknown [Picea sitchensis]
MRLMGEITLSVLYVIKLSCYWHDFCDQLSCIYVQIKLLLRLQ